MSRVAARDYCNRTGAMLEDRRLAGDTLLVGLIMARMVTLQDPPPPWTAGDIARAAWPIGEHVHGPRGLREAADRVRAAIRADMPTPNRASALAEHLPEVNWMSFWRGECPDWVPPRGYDLPVAPKRLLSTVNGDRQRTESEPPELRTVPQPDG